MNGSEWLERATEKIVFGPDREAVRQELADHLQDRQERYAARGLTPEEAEAAALTDMGDPADIAEELGKLHRPWWGYLRTLSKCLLALSIFAAIFAVSFVYDHELIFWESYSLQDLYPDMVVVSEQQLPGSVDVGDYTVTATASLLEPAAEGQPFLCLSLRFLPHIPWEPANTYGFYSHQRDIPSITDDSGRTYTLKNGAIRNLGGLYSFPLSPVRLFHVGLLLEDGVPPQWVDIPLGVSDRTVRVDLDEGVTCR